MTKVDSIIAENPEMTLDQLVSSRKINSDQKAQALKKPHLEVQRAQLEEQIATYKKIETEFHERAGKEQEELKAAHEKALAELRSQIKPQEEPVAAASEGETLKASLLSLSRFLRAAAARRMIEDDESEETRAFEGALLLFYGGDETAVDAMEKLINGADEGVLSTEGSQLDVTCKWRDSFEHDKS
jgi:molybdopterin converting factor small subunit